MDTAGVSGSSARCRQIEGGAQPRSLPSFRREGPSSTRRYVPPSLRELIQQCLGLLEIGRVKALGKPRVDLSQQVTRLPPFPLLVPETTETHRGPQLQRSCSW